MEKLEQKNYIISEIKKIENHFIGKDFDEVINRSIKLLKKHPGIVLAYNFLGSAYRQKNNGILAEKAFREALSFDPKNVKILSSLAALYRLAENYKLSEEFFQKALKINPNNPTTLCNFGNLLRDINKFDEAINLYLKALTFNRRLPIVLLNLSATYQVIGKFELSIKYSKELLNMFPNITLADKQLSHILDYTKDDFHQESMLKKINNEKIKENEKIPLFFALSKSYEDQKNYKNAYKFIEKGNKAQKKYLNYKIDGDIRQFLRIKEIFNNFDFESLFNNGLGQNLIFIVGLPRSGTTLTHQIIGAHKNTYGAGELNALTRILEPRIYNNKFIENFISSKSIDLNNTKKIAEQYISQLQKTYSTDKIIIDKSPLNFRWIGFIKILFPKAKIIHCTRNVKDNLLSIYKNVFDGSSIPWSYDLDDLTKFRSIYLDLMDFWQKKIPDFIYDSNYETLVKDKENQSKEIINFCELPWDSECLNYHKKENAIKTVSINQARKPIYNTSINSNEKYPELANFFNSL